MTSSKKLKEPLKESLRLKKQGKLDKISPLSHLKQCKFWWFFEI